MYADLLKYPYKTTKHTMDKNKLQVWQKVSNCATVSQANLVITLECFRHLDLLACTCVCGWKCLQMEVYVIVLIYVSVLETLRFSRKFALEFLPFLNLQCPWILILAILFLATRTALSGPLREENPFGKSANDNMSNVKLTSQICKSWGSFVG